MTKALGHGEEDRRRASRQQGGFPPAKTPAGNWTPPHLHLGTAGVFSCLAKLNASVQGCLSRGSPGSNVRFTQLHMAVFSTRFR
jgi:hypothetical protein